MDLFAGINSDTDDESSSSEEEEPWIPVRKPPSTPPPSPSYKPEPLPADLLSLKNILLTDDASSSPLLPPRLILSQIMPYFDLRLDRSFYRDRFHQAKYLEFVLLGRFRSDITRTVWFLFPSLSICHSEIPGPILVLSQIRNLRLADYGGDLGKKYIQTELRSVCSRLDSLSLCLSMDPWSSFRKQLPTQQQGISKLDLRSYDRDTFYHDDAEYDGPYDWPPKLIAGVEELSLTGATKRIQKCVGDFVKNREILRLKKLRVGNMDAVHFIHNEAECGVSADILKVAASRLVVLDVEVRALLKVRYLDFPMLEKLCLSRERINFADDIPEVSWCPFESWSLPQLNHLVLLFLPVNVLREGLPWDDWASKLEKLELRFCPAIRCVRCWPKLRFLVIDDLEGHYEEEELWNGMQPWILEPNDFPELQCVSISAPRQPISLAESRSSFAHLQHVWINGNEVNQ